jgi:DNA invertase Pin-like site-specific DNA recombinase
MPRRTAKPSAPAPVAYSYTRFSKPEQAEGDSLRRQDDLRDAWLARSGAVLDTSLTLRDEGVSAFTGGHRQNPDRHALAAFLELVRRGRIRRGSYLVVESLDRLSREHIRPALTLLLNLIDAGVRVVQLLPVEAVYDEKVEPMALMMAIMELSRGHAESAMKSERCSRAWSEKKRRAAIDGKPITRVVPSWIEVRDGGFRLKPAAADLVRRMYRMAVGGVGIDAITKTLNREGVPTLGGRADAWAPSTVASILANRAAVGEYQPMKGKAGHRTPDGDPIRNYFPAVLTEDEWFAARASIGRRRPSPGRIGREVNLFSGLLRDARDGGPIHRFTRTHPVPPALVSYQAMRGVPGSRFVSFPLKVFERAVLSRLHEVDPREVLPREDPAAGRVLALSGKRADLEARIGKVKAKLLDGGDLDSLVDVLRSLEAKLTVATEALAEAQREAASPLAGAWGECKSLLDVLDAAPDPTVARLRLRSVLRRLVAGIWCLFLHDGLWRIAAVQIWFTGDGHRDYLILHRGAGGGNVPRREPVLTVSSLAEKTAAGPLDLRKREDAERLDRELGKLSLPAPRRRKKASG